MSDTVDSDAAAAAPDSEAAAPAADASAPAADAASAPTSAADTAPASTGDGAAAETAPAAGADTSAEQTAPAAGDTSAAGQADAGAANPALSQEHLDWTSQFCGVQVGAGGSADSAESASAQGRAAGGSGDGAAASGGGVLDSIADGAKSLWNKAGDAVDKVEDTAKDIGGKIEDGVKDIGGKMADVASDVGGKIGDAAKDIGGKIEDEAKAAWDKAGQVIDQVKKKAEGVIDDTVKAVSDGAKAVVDKAKEIGGEIEDKVKKTADDLKDQWDHREDYAKAEPPLPRVDIGAPQQERADKLLSQMSDDEKKKVRDILDKASPDAKTYLTKALASKHSAAEIEDFSKKIEGKDQQWMDEHLHLVGAPDGRGIKQQWHDSCGPTTVQAMKGELDPMYALKMHEDNADTNKADDSDGTAKNPDMAKQQKDDLEGGGGVAVPRDKDGGKGMVMDGLLDAQKDKTGVKFDDKDVMDNDDATTKGLDDAQKALKSGLPVPVRVGNNTDGHFILMTAVADGPPRTFSFHDPYRGINQNYTEDQIKKKQLDIAGWNKLTDIHIPSATGN